MNKNNKFTPSIPNRLKQKDIKLRLLHKHITEKIAATKDEGLIRHYLQQCQLIAQQRLQIQKEALL